MDDPKHIMRADFQKAFDKISFKETKHSWDNRGIFSYGLIGDQRRLETNDMFIQ